MVYDGVLLGLIVGLFRGGWRQGLTRFGNIRLTAGWMFPVLLVVQFVIFYFQEQYAWLASINGFLFMTIYIAGLVFLWLNKRNTGFWLIFIGVLLNFLVMAVNGGRMPVSLSASSVLGPYYTDMLSSGSVISKHFMMDANTHLSLLGDIIPLSKPYPRTQVISIGDVVMNVGMFLFIQNIMVVKRKKKAKQRSPHHA